MGEQVYWVVEVAIKPGELDNFRSLMRDMVAATEANEPGTLNYEWHLTPDETGCHIYERYADSAAVLTHLGTFGERFAGRFLSTVEISRLVVYGSPNAAVREAAGGLGAAFMTPIGGFAR